MRMSNRYGKTLRETPAYADVLGYQLLLRAGFIRQLASGIFTYLPLGMRIIRKLEGIVREELENIGGQEILMPVVHPADIWKQTKRWYQIGSELGRFKDKNGRDMALAMTSEEVVACMMKGDIRSHRDLPVLIYHIQTKWRDDPRPRGGLIRAREFSMKDSYSLDKDEKGLDTQYRNHFQAYFNIFNRCGLPAIAVKSDVGVMGGKLAHEYMYLTDIGEDTLIICDGCGYAANRQIAVFKKVLLEKEPLKAIEKVETPECKSIEALSLFLNIPETKTCKAVLLMADFGADEKKQPHHRLVFAVIRGDLEVNETKLLNAIGARSLTPASEEEIQRKKIVPGYASPIGIKDVLVVCDDSVVHSTNLVAGANETGFHLLNVNYGRDFTADVTGDIASACEKNSCAHCGSPLKSVRGVEVGNIFKLGTRYSSVFGCTYTDVDGKARPVVMGSYGIGIGRLLACLAEEYNDKDGLKWPVTVAPFHVHLISLTREPEINVIRDRSEEIYQTLQSHGIEVLLDDRSDMPGVKFKDADLIGIPIRITVSERAMKAGGIEYKRRDLNDRRVIPFDAVLENIQMDLKALGKKIDAGVKSVPFE